MLYYYIMFIFKRGKKVNTGEVKVNAKQAFLESKMARKAIPSQIRKLYYKVLSKSKKTEEEESKSKKTEEEESPIMKVIEHVQNDPNPSPTHPIPIKKFLEGEAAKKKGGKKNSSPS